MATTVHPSAIVDAGARVDARCSFGQDMFVANDVRIGIKVNIQNNVSVYEAAMLGVPAHQSGWMGRHGEQPDLPLTGDGEARYPHTIDRCTLNTGSVALAGA